MKVVVGLTSSFLIEKTVDKIVIHSSFVAFVPTSLSATVAICLLSHVSTNIWQTQDRAELEKSVNVIDFEKASEDSEDMAQWRDLDQL